MQCLISSIKIKKYIFNFYSIHISTLIVLTLTLKFMPGPRDNGGHSIEMHVLWYNGCNCGSTRCINHMYKCGIRQRRAFVSMQPFGQSKVTSRSLQGQSFMNSNTKIKIHTKPYCSLLDRREIYRDICVAVPQNQLK